jgi:hypothetical protein
MRFTAVDDHVVAARVAAPQQATPVVAASSPATAVRLATATADAHPTQADLLDRWADHAQRPAHGGSRPPRMCNLPTLMQRSVTRLTG